MSNQITVSAFECITSEIKSICIYWGPLYNASEEPSVWELNGMGFNLISQHALGLVFVFLGIDRNLTRLPDISKEKLLIPQVALGPFTSNREFDS